MEIENLGFIAALQEQDRIQVKVLNFYSNPTYFSEQSFPTVHLTFLDIASLFFRIPFLKIFIKFGGNLKKSLVNAFLNFPDLFDSLLNREIKETNICFASIRPGQMLSHIHTLAKTHHKVFVYHEISRFNDKYSSFFARVEKYGSHLISAIEKKEYLQKIYPDSRYFEIKQWIYKGQKAFLNLKIPTKSNQVFGAVSRIDYGKNFDLIFSALVILKREGKLPQFRLFGDGPEITRLKELAKSNEIQSQIEFCGGFGFEQRAEVFSKLDILIMPSLFEGGPLTVLEGMAAGRPIIATNVGDVRNRVQSNVNGFVLDSMESPEELALKMNFYLENPENIAIHGANSREKFLNEFEENRAKNIFIDSISNLIENRL